MIRLAALCLMLAATPALAGGSLDGLTVTLRVETWNDPTLPLLVSEGRTVTVGKSVEFAMGPEGWTGGLDVVPVQVEIGANRIEFTYGDFGRGRFWGATFNGYILEFEAGCALFAGARVDPSATTMGVGDADIGVGTRAIRVNVAGRDYGPGQRLAIDLDVEDCPLS